MMSYAKMISLFLSSWQLHSLYWSSTPYIIIYTELRSNTNIRIPYNSLVAVITTFFQVNWFRLAKMKQANRITCYHAYYVFRSLAWKRNFYEIELIQPFLDAQRFCRWYWKCFMRQLFFVTNMKLHFFKPYPRWKALSNIPSSCASNTWDAKSHTIVIMRWSVSTKMKFWKEFKLTIRVDQESFIFCCFFS